MPLFSSSLSSPSPSPFLPKPYLNQAQAQAQSTTDPPSRVRIPTAPWMTTPPLLLPPDHLSDPSSARSTDASSRRANDNRSSSSSRSTRSLTRRIPNGRTRKTVFEIIKSVKSLQKLEPIDQIEEKFDEIDGIGEWEEEEVEVERPNLPWIGGKTERDGEIVVFRREEKKREITEAEKRIAPEELHRLRMEGRRIDRSICSSKFSNNLSFIVGKFHLMPLQ